MNEKYEQLLVTLKSLIEDNKYDFTILANASALIYDSLDNLNWVGFYILKDNSLHLGPFVGKPACINIPLSKGVCGYTITTNQTQVVANVNEFKGHIACDSNSKSEICVPLHLNGKTIGLLDIDAPIYDRFSEIEAKYLEDAVKIIEIELSKTNIKLFD